jgi:hypothetical protein
MSEERISVFKVPELVIRKIGDYYTYPGGTKACVRAYYEAQWADVTMREDINYGSDAKRFLRTAIKKYAEWLMYYADRPSMYKKEEGDDDRH